MRGQVSLEALLVLAGILGVVGVFWVGTEPVRKAALDQAGLFSDEAAFERVRFAVRAADVMPPGFWHEERFALEHNVSVVWSGDSLAWTSPFGALSVGAVFEGGGRAALVEGTHTVAVRKNRGVDVVFS
ncbi:hypothetical protein HY572_01705 [Candidatus Micrarchaeota archaeon]|nr:hypothetical protein [Candidatus Micrarchaeota archaeon]